MNTVLSERRKSWLLLAALWLALLLLASLRPLAVPDEGRYGEVGRWMLMSGDWLTPRLNGIPFFHKPPLTYWLEAASLAAFGVSPLALRLVSAAHVGLLLVALYLAVRRIGDEALARRTALVLGTSLGFLVGGQYVNHDMAVATWISLAIGCFALAFQAGERPDAALARLGFAACALGLLSKGLIGLVLPGLVLCTWLLWTRQLGKVLRLPWVSGLSLFALIALPWFVLAQQKYPQLLDYLFINQHFRRYTASSYNNPQPWWFYLVALALLMFPWVFFALASLWRGRTAPAQPKPIAAPWVSLCWIWVLAILVFFSIPRSKLIGYILPVLPALALLAALGWQRHMAQRRRSAGVWVGLCAINLVLALVVVLQVGPITRSSRAQDVAAYYACAAQPDDTLYVTDAYPYDLPLYAQTRKPLVVLADWAALRRSAGDGWERELFEGADFDAQAGAVLQPLEQLASAAQESGHWLLTRYGSPAPVQGTAWTQVYADEGWVLYRSVLASGAKGPEAAEHKGLYGCHNQGQH